MFNLRKRKTQRMFIKCNILGWTPMSHSSLSIQCNSDFGMAKHEHELPSCFLVAPYYTEHRYMRVHPKVSELAAWSENCKLYSSLPPGAVVSAILWVSLVSFDAITLCVDSQRVFIVVSLYVVIDSVRKLLDTPSYELICISQEDVQTSFETLFDLIHI
jgi:hypothetical protein